MTTKTGLIKGLWDKFLDAINQDISAETEKVERAMGFSRLYEQLRDALENSDTAASGWAYPIDIFVGDDGSSLFSIVAQNGKLFQVPMTVSGENLTLGEWTQVTEIFQPVTQSKFSVTRQKNGTHRWLCIAATTVLNRVGEMDSCELFDSFIAQAAKSGKYPRLDFYHLGESNPKVWEFGTADYLARDGVCYIASGTFDEDHSLAKAFIEITQSGSTEWGNSIEFYAYTEPEIIVLDPKIQVPVYREGENTRISVVLEKDAACLFTRMIETIEEKRRTMDSRVEAALLKLFEDDEDKVLAFIESADVVNQTVKNEKLIHRTKKKVNPEPVDPDDEDTEDEESDEDEEDKDEEPTNLVLDDEAVKHLASQVVGSETFTKIAQSIEALTAAVTKLTTERETDAKEIGRLNKANTKLAEKVAALSVDDTSKKQTYLQDLPARRQIQATYRRRDQEDSTEGEEDSAVIAKRTLAKLPSY